MKGPRIATGARGVKGRCGTWERQSEEAENKRAWLARVTGRGRYRLPAVQIVLHGPGLSYHHRWP